VKELGRVALVRESLRARSTIELSENNTRRQKEGSNWGVSRRGFYGSKHCDTVSVSSCLYA